MCYMYCTLTSQGSYVFCTEESFRYLIDGKKKATVSKVKSIFVSNGKLHWRWPIVHEQEKIFHTIVFL